MKNEVKTESVGVCAKECLDVQIDHGMHSRGFSVASSVDTEEKGNLFQCSGVCVNLCVCWLPIGAQRHMAVQLQKPDSAI